MCGITGIIASGRADPELVRAMAGAIAYRGPDDSGVWIDEEGTVGLGHRRLSIVDLSPSGHQPMTSSDGRWVIAYNGEIYNHRELRAEVEAAGGGPGAGGQNWRGHSDTETLVEAISIWGLGETLRRSVGMFAIALWDRRERRLFLARDRFGEKPLYYGWVGRDFVFGSELDALRTHPGFDNKIDRQSLRLMAGRGYVPSPRSIYRNIYKLEPARILSLSTAAALQPFDPASPDAAGRAMSSFWSYGDAMARGLDDPFTSEEDALDTLEATLATAIRGQAVADVPVGAFLSGGIDSSTVVALYQKHSPSSVRTYSIGFEETGFNEAEYAKAVAAHFGTEHHERYVTVREAQEIIPSLPTIYQEPFADSSQIPTHIVSRFAREHVTVALSGDGGDELFGGYNHYFSVPRFVSMVDKVPEPLRATVGAVLEQVPPALWTAALRTLGRGEGAGEAGFKLQRASRRLRRASDRDQMLASFMDDWWGDPSPVIGSAANGRDGPFHFDFGRSASTASRLMYCDAMSYLTDDILCKVDRAAMAVSLETRVPFLDHRVAEVACRIPLEMKMRDGKGKHLVRRLLFRHAPPALFDRPKAGFGIPVGQWIRGPLRDWAEDLLNPERLKREGYFDAVSIRRRWDQHVSGRRDSTTALWTVLMFQAWLAAQGARAPAAERPQARVASVAR